jgi:glycosyltransferase involved in cell wall biosynthesis
MRFPGPPAWFLRGLLRRMHLRRAAMFTHGDAVQHFRNEVGIEIPGVPPGVDSALFRPARDERERRSVRAELGVADHEFMLITVGRLIQGKGHGFLLEALAGRARAARIRLFVAGDGILRERLESKARDLGLAGRVEMMGHLGKAELARRLQAADAFCLMSEYENYSNAVLEAMSAGLPVIATDVGGFLLQVKDGRNGFLIRPGDRDGLLARIGELAGDAELRRRLADAGRRFAAQFQWESTAKRVEEIYADSRAA